MNNKRSLFIISSPYQALCCVEAINDLGIVDYDIFIMIYKGINKRVEQIKSVFDYYEINYKIKYCTKFSFLGFIGNYLFRSPKYHSVFSGDYYSATFVLFGILNLSNSGKLIYLDDGNSTISILKNQFEYFKMTEIVYKFIVFFSSILCLIKKIKFRYYFYTTYFDIHNSRYHIFENHFSYLLTLKETNTSNCNLFIGTAPLSFCKVNNITRDEYLHVLFDSLNSIKDVDNLIYIPHGQDNDPEVRDFCKRNNISYFKPDVCIELYLIKSGLLVKSAYGFTSSALFSIKRFFPNSNVVNILVKKVRVNLEYKEISKYYEINGIATDIINI